MIVLLGMSECVEEDRRDVVIDEGVAVPPAVTDGLHQVGFPQHPQMMRDQRLRGLQKLDELGDVRG